MANWSSFQPGQTWVPTMGTATGYWTSTSLPTVAFTSTDSYTHLWGDWATQTWGYIMSSGLQWQQMAGYNFVTVTHAPVTVWA